MLDFAAIQLKSSFEHKGCPLCYLRHKDVARYIYGVLYEYVNDPDVRDSFVASLGYCHDHAWQQQRTEMGRCKDVLGTGTMYESVLLQNLRGLEQFIATLHADDSPTGWLSRLGGKLKVTQPGSYNHSTTDTKEQVNLPFGLSPSGRCRVCEVRDEADEQALHTFAANIEQEKFVAAYRNSGGLCLPHLSAAINPARGGAGNGVRDLLIKLTLEKLQEKARALRSLMGNYYRRSPKKPFALLGTRACRSLIEQFTGDLVWHPWGDSMQGSMGSGSDPCPVCAVLKNVAGERMKNLPDQTSLTSVLRAESATSQGFCGRHAHLLCHLVAAQSAGAVVAAFYLELSERTIAALQCELYSPSRNTPAIQGWVRSAMRLGSNRSVPSESWESQFDQGFACPICCFEANEEYQAIIGFVAQLADPAFRECYTATDGLCLPHLRMALSKSDTEGRVFLAIAARDKVANLLHLVREYTRKHNWHFRDEPKFPEEQQAVIRTIRFQVGQPDCL